MSSRSSMNMLRTRRRDNNVKPNRRDFRAGRLDRKSSRGMIYENEELRLRTININAEIERGQYDIKKLKRENELLRKEIWCLRDEYEKLDKLLKEKDLGFSSDSTTSESDSSSSSADDKEDSVSKCETVENETNVVSLSRNFETLSVVPEESTENSDKTSNGTSSPHDVIQADQSYPVRSKNESDRINCDDNYATYAGLRLAPMTNNNQTNVYQNVVLVPKHLTYGESETLRKGDADVLVKTDNGNFFTRPNWDEEGNVNGREFTVNSRSTFSNGGNLEELLKDLENVSQDILDISNSNQNGYFNPTRRCNPTSPDGDKPFKSELNVTLVPQPMSLIDLEKYRDIQRSMNSTPSKSTENLTSRGAQIYNRADQEEKGEFLHFHQQCTDLPEQTTTTLHPSAPKIPANNTNTTFAAYLDGLRDNYVNGDYFARYNPENFQLPDGGDKNISGLESDRRKSRIPTKQTPFDYQMENDEIKTKPPDDPCDSERLKEETDNDQTKQKLGLRKKVSIHFRGKSDKQKKTKKLNETKSDDNKTKTNHQKTSSKDSNRTVSESDPRSNSETRTMGEKTSSASPDRKKTKEEKKWKKHRKQRQRRATITSLESRDHRGRSHSVTTDRSNNVTGSNAFFDDYNMLNSDRDSLSSCGTLSKMKQMNFSGGEGAPGGKVPWCGCWGNGCI